MIDKNMAFRVVYKLDYNPNWFYTIKLVQQKIEMIRLFAFEPFFISNIAFKPVVTCKSSVFAYPVSNLRFDFYVSKIKGLSCPFSFRAIPQIRGLVKALGPQKTSKLLKSSTVYIQSN